MKPPKRVLITNTTGDFGASIAGELAAAGCEVIGADFDWLPLGLRSRHLTRIHRLPAPDDPSLDDTLIGIVQRERPDVVLPLGTRATATVCRLRPALERLTGLNVPAHDAFQATFDHAICQIECARLGIPCPRAYSLEEACAVLEQGVDTPMLVVKPRTDVGAATGLSYVTDTVSLRQRVADCEKHFGGAVIQEFIPGAPDSMRAALLLFDRNSHLAAAFTLRKVRQWPMSGGVTAVGISIADKQLAQIALPFFMKWRWRGPAEVEFKLDPRDDRYKVIEINGRFPGYGRFASLCGLPIGRLAAALASGKTAPAALQFPEYAEGRKYVNPGLFARTVLASLRANPSKLTALKQAAADCAGTGAQFRTMLSDPFPMIGRLLQDAARFMSGRPWEGRPPGSLSGLGD